MGYNRQEIEESLASSRYDDVFATYLLLGRKNTDVSFYRFFFFCLLFLLFFITQKSRVLVGTLFFLHNNQKNQPIIHQKCVSFINLNFKQLTNFFL